MKNIIEQFKEKERLIHDTFLKRRGAKVKIKPVKQTSDTVPAHDADPFNIDVKWESHQYGTIEDFEDEYDGFCVLFNEGFIYQSVSIEEFVSSEHETFSDIQCRITGKYLPVGSKIEFERYPQYKFEIGEAMRVRGLSSVLSYKLVRT
jgi:hypothetical protein